MKTLKYIVLLFLTISAFQVYAYKPKRTNSFSSYNEHTNEIAYAINISYLKYEKKFAPQLHIHYSKYFTDFFSLGIGYGGVYYKNNINTFDFELSFRIYNKLIFSLKPGMAIKQQSGKTKSLYSMGFGSNYEIDLSDKVHIGPMVEIDVLQDDIIYLAGFHMGFTF